MEKRAREAAGDMTVTAWGDMQGWQHPHPKILCLPNPR